MSDNAKKAGKAVDDATKNIPESIEGIGKKFGEMLNTFTGGAAQYGKILEEMEKDAHGSLPNATLHYALFYNTTETN